MVQRIAVSSADFIRNIGRWQQEALQQPVVITHHGRERLVLAAPDRFRFDAANDGSGGGGAARELRAIHSALLTHMEEGCLTFAPDGSITSANAAAAEFLGRSEEEFRGRQLTGVMSDLLSLVIMDRVVRVIRTRSAEQFEADAADGRRLCFRVYASATGVTVLFRNTTEMVRLQRELEECRALVNVVRRHDAAAVLKLDQRGRLESVDDAFCAWTGFAAADLMGHRLAELVAGQERRELTQFVEQILGGSDADQVSVDILGRSGGVTRCTMTMAPILSDFVPSGIIALAAPAQ